MPWKETSPVKERMRFVLDYEEGLFELRELAMQYGISRKTAYKWLERWEADGVEGLGDRPPIAARVANRTEAELEGWFVEQRRRHKTWGPKKLLDVLERRRPGWCYRREARWVRS
jgi:transposase